MCAPEDSIKTSLSELKFDQNGLLPVIVQDVNTHEVLMLAYTNREAIEKTLQSGEAYFWSRSRQELWHKGKTSGNFLKVSEIRYDCDADTLLYIVSAAGPACHTGNKSCFFRIIASKEDFT